jgi:hypothetical protein
MLFLFSLVVFGMTVYAIVRRVDVRRVALPSWAGVVVVSAVALLLADEMAFAGHGNWCPTRRILPEQAGQRRAAKWIRSVSENRFANPQLWI